MTFRWLVLLVVVAMMRMTESQLCNCVTLSTGCNCSALGSCCVGDVNICNVLFNQCVAANPLIALNKTKGCPCVQQYNTCFHNLVCQASTQAKAGSNCLLLQGDYVGGGHCPSTDIDCTFSPLPTLPTVVCSAQTSCSACSKSVNCQWCNQNASGICADLASTCTAANPSDTVSLIYSFTAGTCDQNNTAIGNKIASTPSMITAMRNFFGNNPALSPAGITLIGVSYFAVNQTHFLVQYSLQATNPPFDTGNFQAMCDSGLQIATSQLGVVDVGRYNCFTSEITGSNPYTVKTYITDSDSGTAICPGGSGGNGPSSGGGLDTGAIIGIAVGAGVAVILILAIIGFFIWKRSQGEERV